MSALTTLLDGFRNQARSEREKGTYFEELICAYLQHEPMYRELYADVLPYAEWAKREGRDGRDVGIDLVSIERGTGDVHAIQCKLYAPDYRVQKSDIDSFFTASGQRPFVHRLLFATTDKWSEHAEAALVDQQPAVTKIDLHALETSLIDWTKFHPGKEAPALKAKKSLRPHQKHACDAVRAGLARADRGKLIMACGTGKTFTSLKIAEDLAGAGGEVLFLVPSLALLSQTLTEWTQESATPLRSFAVCSDSDVGKKRGKSDDVVQTLVHELQYPATTEPKHLAREVAAGKSKKHMTVVFATYHSIDVVSRAQKKHGLSAFDLIICDEAHRTTGAKFEDEDESHFVKIHDNASVRGDKRVYMTATPRIYANAAKAKAETESVTLCSMDDPKLYGEALYTLTFSEAVTRDLLVDYKVIVLSIERSIINQRIQDLLKDESNQLKVDDAAKIVGCWKALTKQGLALADDVAPMRRAVAFCQVIERNSSAKVHKVSSKQIAGMFEAVVDAYCEQADEDEAAVKLVCQAQHVDGNMNATEKEARLAWLKAEAPADTCRILSNVRCLSEGVDVPALDAVLFLSPRASQVDVVQSVGRVMRKAPGKTRGYVILPVVIPDGLEPHEALADNETYRVVWQVLQALRSHDDRFDAMINKLELTGADPRKMEVIAITDSFARKARKENGDRLRETQTSYGIGATEKTKKRRTASAATDSQIPLTYETGELEKAIYAKMVQKVGNRFHWEEWANDIAKIARTHIGRIQGILDNAKNKKEREIFAAFAAELRDDLNGSLDDAEVVEMLAQHLITKPVFDALFASYSFASHNPMSKAMQSVLDVLQAHRIEKEADTLQKFYDSVKLRAEGIESAEGKQKIIVELYDKFFRNAFPKMAERLGIVYTPVEVVDFILHSVNDLLRSEFGQTLGSPGVHIIDPFTGTGTFITRLLQSGLITKDELPRKYKSEIHANELVLLAYYIAAINIESVYHGLVGGQYQPFEGICLTDTFQMYEKEDLVDLMLEHNSARRKRQKKLDIRVIIGNPPYSVGQKSQNDNNQNVAYPHLDARIAETYAARGDAVLKNALYDSYVRAIRWASDRIGESGIIGFVTNGGFIDANTANGLRQCLVEEFSDLYVFHLRGNQRTSGDLSRREGGKIFGSGSRAPVAISLLVRNPSAKENGRIHYRDIGDYLSREEKLQIVQAFQGVSGVTATDGWTNITPDAHGDWIKQRDASFTRFVVLGDKSGSEPAVFETYSNGVKTNRDAWAYNPSKRSVSTNMHRMIDFYNSEVERFERMHGRLERKAREARVDDFIDTDPTKMSWDRPQRAGVIRGRHAKCDERHVFPSLYRPFMKQWLYFDAFFNNCVYQMPRLFPRPDAENRTIMVKQRLGGLGGTGHLALMANVITEIQTDGGTQCFPLYVYDTDDSTDDADDTTDAQPSLFAATKKPAAPKGRRDAITDAGLAYFQSAYPDEKLSKEDLFYYVYGMLHSPEYRERYADNLGKELPRIPRVKTAADFRAFSRAGRALGDLHVGYEHAEEYAARIDTGSLKTPTSKHYRVEKMRFGKAGKDKDRTTIHYNDFITVRDIPLQAYDYVVNGKPAIEWVMERQSVTTDKDSGIVKDANDWAIETMHDPRYPLSLLLRVITVSLQTVQVVTGLPKLDISD